MGWRGCIKRRHEERPRFAEVVCFGESGDKQNGLKILKYVEKWKRRIGSKNGIALSPGGTVPLWPMACPHEQKFFKMTIKS